MTYAQARMDHEYLWQTYAEAYDISGAYVDQDDLARLLKTPTRAMARSCYESQIQYWFSAGPEPDCSNRWKSDPAVLEIAERHHCKDDLLNLDFNTSPNCNGKP